MLAQAGYEVPRAEGLGYEPKGDGFRAIVTVTGGEAVLTSRNGKDLTDRFREAARAVERGLRAPDAVLAREGPVVYDVDLRKGQKTGLFLDQRENREAAARYARGRLLDALKQLGEYDNTIIVFSSDHGLAIGSHGLIGKLTARRCGIDDSQSRGFGKINQFLCGNDGSQIEESGTAGNQDKIRRPSRLPARPALARRDRARRRQGHDYGHRARLRGVLPPLRCRVRARPRF